MEKKYFVYGEGTCAPVHEHATRESAEREAERLARNNKGKKFFVTVPIAACCSNDVIWDRLPDEEIPF
jgi:hypothetical protein